MEYFNIKLNNFLDLLVSEISKISIPAISGITVLMASIQSNLTLGPYSSSIVFGIVFITGILSISAFPRIKYVIYLLSLLTITISDQTLILMLILTGLLILDKMFSNYSERISLLIISLFTHIGDSITTYIGVNKGLTESNIFVANLIKLMGPLSAFAVKIPIGMILIYSFYRLNQEDYKALTSLLYSTGLYLVITNLALIQSSMI